MGQEIKAQQYSRADHTRYRRALQRCLATLEQLLRSDSFEQQEARTGLELEINLVDENLAPALVNEEVLAHLDDPAYTTELGRFMIELNVEPRRIDGQALLGLEAELRKSLNRAADRAGDRGADLVTIGILPTLEPPEPGTQWMTPSARYEQLNQAVLRARREDIEVAISGAEELEVTSDSILLEAPCTAAQLHLQVAPERFADYWNSAQVLAGPQLAMGANSPYFFGRQLWAETRIELFRQSTDPRSTELRHQGVRDLVPFGESWISSALDLFSENVRYYPTLLPETSEEDPCAVLAAGGTPSLAELRLHNGTIYRWNRPVYDVVDGRPHLRIENRVLPSGPTAADVVANAVFYYGAVAQMVRSPDPVWRNMTFDAAARNFDAGARHGVSAQLYWPGAGTADATALVLHRLLPLAQEGLEALGVGAPAIDRYLGIIEGRARLRTNGSAWQVAAVRAAEDRGRGRGRALREMLAQYIENMHSGEPVHTWSPPAGM